MQVAIYSGTIPSTTFIEKLIVGVAARGIEVLLFGVRKKPRHYEEATVSQFPRPEQPLALALTSVLLMLRLRLQDPAAYKILRGRIHAMSGARGTRLKHWARYAPIALKKPDIFHLQWVKGAEEWLVLRELGIKIVASFRGTHINSSPIADEALAESYRRTFPFFDAFHAVSDAIALEAAKYGAEPGKIRVIRPAVGPELLEQPLSINDISDRRPLRMLSVGRDHWKKGYRYALDACALLAQKGVAFEYTIVGGADCDSLLHQRDQLNLGKQVKLTGGQSHEEVLKLYREYDLFLLPSLEEGIANVVLEAMALGCPVLTADCGGMNEVVEDGVNGLLFQALDAAAMAAKIEVFCGVSKETVHSFRTKARETIRERHLIDGQVGAMLGLYENLIGG